MSLVQLKARSKKSLAVLARKHHIRGVENMRKDQLVRALSAKRNGTRGLTRHRHNGKPTKAKRRHTARNRVRKHITSNHRLNPRRNSNGEAPKGLGRGLSSEMRNGYGKDRIVLFMRDSYWLHAYWEITLASVQRAEAALREEWHGAKPILRVFDVSSEDTTASSETPIRDIEIHGCVNNWYIDVSNPPRSYRVDIGYLSRRGRFYALAHSNVVVTPRTGTTDGVDENWASVKEQFDRICATSNGNENQGANGEPKQISEEQLMRALSSGPISGLGFGFLTSGRKRRYWFQLDAELIVHGCTQPSSRVTLQGERVHLRPDGTFTVRFRLPDKRLIIPATAISPDGSEERTIVLAVERNTKELEPMMHDCREE